MDNLSFGKHLKLARKDKKMTAQNLADELDMSPKSIWQIESGRRTTTLSVFVDICNILKTSPEYFLGKDLSDGLNKPESEYCKLFKTIYKLTPSELAMITDFSEMLIQNRNKYKGK